MIKFLRICSILLVFCFLCAPLTACSKNGDGDGDGETPDGFNPYPYPDLSVYMELPDYKSLTIKQSRLDSYVSTEIAALCIRKGFTEEISEGAVKKWDTVNISYKGYIDGKEFVGGSADSYDLTIGSNTFIAGFEDGVVGMLKGETKDLNLKFPDDYGAVQYAGKDVVFTVTVKKITRPKALTDAFCAENTPYDTVAEFTESVKKGCVFQYAWGVLIGECELKGYPDEYTEYYRSFKAYFDSLASENGMTFKDFISVYGASFSQYGLFKGMTESDFERVASNYAKSNVVNDLLTYSIMRAEEIKTEGAEYDAAVKLLEKEQGKSYAELVAEVGEESVIISVINIRISEIIYGYVTVEADN